MKAVTDEEAQRLAALRRYDILDTPPDGTFDRITALAASLFAVPISIISLVDYDRIWFKSHHGLDAKQVPRDPGLCASAIIEDRPYIVTDAKKDIRALSNPLVAGAFGLQLYVAVPLRTSDGYNLGTLCVIDREPRTITNDQIARLQNLASVVMDQMELRLSARRAISELSAAVIDKERALQRAELLAKEIDHRVMNSLQMISALLHLQSRTLNNAELSEQLGLAATRVSAIAQVHRHLHLTRGVESTKCKEYLERLCGDLSSLMRSSNRGEIVVEAIDDEIATARIVPLGLIVTELVTNAAKNGAQRITVSFGRSAEGGYSLSVADDGTGLPADFGPTTGAGFGMKVISSLVQTLGGRLIAGNAKGSRGALFTILFGG